MKAVIYEKHDEIDLNFIINLVHKNEIEKVSKVSLVIVEQDLFYKLSDEGISKGNFIYQFWWQKERFNKGIKLNHFKIISSE